MGFWVLVERVIRESNIVLLVVDARMPELSKNERLRRLIGGYGKELVTVFNKVDLVSKGSLSDIKRDYPDSIFVAGVKNLGIPYLRKYLQIISKRMKIDSPVIGVVGYPNVGKSAIINALAHRSRAAISPTAGTTRGIQFIKAGNLKIIDSPGVVPFLDEETKLGIIGAKNPEKIRNQEGTAIEIIKNMVDRNMKALEDYAGVKLEGDEYAIIEAIGRRKGFLSRGGIVDERKTAIQIIRDWQRGKIKV